MKAVAACAAITNVFDFLTIDEINSRWLLARDAHTVYFLAADDLAADDLDTYGHDYSEWCGATVARRDHEVPVRVLREARKVLGREPGEAVCQGW